MNNEAARGSCSVLIHFWGTTLRKRTWQTDAGHTEFWCCSGHVVLQKIINNDSLSAASTCNTLYNTIQMYLTSIFCSDLDSSQSPLNPIPSSSQLTAWPRPINSFPRSRAWDRDDRPQRIKTSVHNFRRKREWCLSMPICQCCSVFGLW